MFQSFYIYNESNFQTILDITDTSDETSKEDDSSIDSDFVSQDESLSIESDLESIYSELSYLSSIDSDFESSVDDNEANTTDDETIDSNPMYVSSGITVKLMDEELYEGNNDEENDDTELAAIIEVQRRSTNYTDTFTRKIYRKKTNYYEKIINLSIAVVTFAVILNWFS